MRTVTLQSVLLRAWQRAGNEGSDIANITTATRTMMVAAFNERIADCWEFSDWPDLCRIEERTTQGDTTNGFYLDVAQSGQTEFGTVFTIYKDNPATHAAPREVPFSIEQDKIRLPHDAPSAVWVHFRTVPTTYEAGTLSATVPGFLANAAGLYLTSDLLEEDSQFDKAAILEGKALDELVKQQDRIVMQSGQRGSYSAVVP